MYTFNANMSVGDMDYLYEKIQFIGLDINDFQFNVYDGTISLSLYDPCLSKLEEDSLDRLFKTNIVSDEYLSDFIINDYVRDYQLSEPEEMGLRGWFNELKNNTHFLNVKKISGDVLNITLPVGLGVGLFSLSNEFSSLDLFQNLILSSFLAASSAILIKIFRLSCE